MAGRLVVIGVRDETEGMVETAIRDQWEVRFSRFFNYPAPTASTCSDLVPLPQFLRNRGLVGTWLTSSSPALLRLSDIRSGTGVVLTVSCAGKLQEEHYVSKLNFSWPQVSCISGFPARGTRAVFVSYRDSRGEIQKFAFQFSKTSETEEFINALKDILKGESDVKPLCSELVSATSTPSQHISPNRPLYRASNDNRPLYRASNENRPLYRAWNDNRPLYRALNDNRLLYRVSDDLGIVNPAVNLTLELPKRSYYKAEVPSFTQQTMPTNFSTLPPSFTSLLTDYCPIVEQVVSYPTASDEAILKSQIAKYMEDSSFQDMLVKVEKAINEMGSEYTM